MVTVCKKVWNALIKETEGSTLWGQKENDNTENWEKLGRELAELIIRGFHGEQSSQKERRETKNLERVIRSVVSVVTDNQKLFGGKTEVILSQEIFLPMLGTLLPVNIISQNRVYKK